MAYIEEPPQWDEPGVEPPETKKESGYAPGDKPPAQWINWFQNRVYKVLSELQSKSLEASSYTAADVLEKIKTVDGAGSGLDTDLFDGMNSDRFIFGDNQHGTIGWESKDLNDILKSGFYWSYTTTANRPTTNGGMVMHTQAANDDNFASQMYVADSLDRIFYRRKSSGTWQPWVESITTNGGTMNGSLTINNAQIFLDGSNQYTGLQFKHNGTSRYELTYDSVNQTFYLFDRQTSAIPLFVKSDGTLQTLGNNVWHSGNNTVSLAANGWQKLASGMIVQWGSISTVAPNTLTVVTFPISFPSFVRSVVTNVESSTTPSPSTPSFLTATGFQVLHNNADPKTIRWQAIGY